MPSFDHLSPADVKGVADYVLKLDEKAGGAIVQERGGPVIPEGSRASEEADVAPDEKRRFVHTGYFRFLDADGYPAIKPPWGTLTAIDLNRGEILWQSTLGHHDELSSWNPSTGTENYGGPIVTGGGLVFIAATRDEKIRAFDTITGKVLWEAKLPAGGYATPATYAVNGRQYLVVAAGGDKMGTPAGDAYIAFALPK
jgi:quinoprotein glucose dehydrogenase